MAIRKEIRQDDGVTTSYHRILYIMQTVNRQNTVAVLSYVDGEARESEKENVSQPYKKAATYEVGYDPNMTVAAAYGFLKTLPEFAGATDV